jgi:hypothetical protein
VPLFLLLAIPILLNLKDIYTWVDPEAAGLFSEHELHILHEQAQLPQRRLVHRPHVLYLSSPASSPGGCSAWFTRQDASGDPALTQKQRNLGIGALPLVALVLTFAAFDWLMSLNPIWFSTIFGVYYFAGSFWSTHRVLIIVTTWPGARILYGQFVSRRAHAEPRQAAVRLHLLLGLHRLFADDADLDRQPARGGSFYTVRLQAAGLRSAWPCSSATSCALRAAAVP